MYTWQENLVDPQRWNRYAYARNNPLRYIDPDGRDILVIENGPTQGNPFGHTAIAVSAQGVYSFGNNTAPGSSPSEYLLREAPNRDTTLFYLKTTPEQDAAATKYLQSFGGTDLNPSDGVGNPTARRVAEIAYAACKHNCSTRVHGALDAARVPATGPNPPTWNSVIGGLPPHAGPPSTAGKRVAAQGAVRMRVPKGATSVPPSVKAFEPVKDRNAERR